VNGTPIRRDEVQLPTPEDPAARPGTRPVLT
jgi:hypothetical protein